MTLYETIFVRRSVRKYDNNQLDEPALQEIKNYIDNAKQLPQLTQSLQQMQLARFEIADSGKLKGGTAPYAILAYSKDNGAALINIGYTLQGADLWLQSKGYGSIWCGMASPKESSPDFRILLGFGKTSVPLRAGENDFKRKKLAAVSNEDNVITRAARIAPSAVNFQPWRLNFADGKITIHSNVSGLGKAFPGKLYLFNLGIITKHVELAFEHEGKIIKSIDIHESGKDSFISIY